MDNIHTLIEYCTTERLNNMNMLELSYNLTYVSKLIKELIQSDKHLTNPNFINLCLLAKNISQCLTELNKV